MTIQTYLDKRLHIFDYDETLYINNKYENKIDYQHYIIKIIKNLKQQGKLIAMASHNVNAESYFCHKYPEIYQCFDMFVCEYPLNKDIMVSNILEQLNCKPDEAIFYDDRQYNLDLVEQLGVFCYLVDETIGIKFENIVIKD
jgi:HAD superfamily phosphatase (TIGR01681 family)